MSPIDLSRSTYRLYVIFLRSLADLVTASHNHIKGPVRRASALGLENLLIYKTGFCT